MTQRLRRLVLVCSVMTVCAMSGPLFAQETKPSPGADAPRAGPPDATKVDEVRSESPAEAAKADERQATQPQDTKPVASVPPAEDDEPPPTDDIPKTKSPEVFVPSEDISEDLAVSFPVDI